MMRVAIDVSAVHATSGGVLRYLRELVAHLPAVDVEPVLLEQKVRVGEGPSGLFPPSPELTQIGCAPSSRLLRLLWEQVALTRIVQGLRDVPVLHSPHYTMPRPFPFGHRTGRPASAVTIHDLTFFTLPELHEPSKRLLFRSAIRHAASHAGVLICVSDRTASLLHRHVDVQVPVVVAPHGVDTNRFRPTSPATADSDAAVLGRLGIDGPYLLCLGTIAPHKNLGPLLRAFGAVCREHGPGSLRLVLAGQSWPGAWEAVAEWASRDVVRLGFVSEADLVPLMRNARLFVSPSFEEGFGFPVLEALACGVAVVTGEDTTMADVAADQAVLVDPRSAEDLLRGINTTLSRDGGIDGENDPVARAARVARASAFTWSRSAAAHAEAYRTAADAR